MKIPLVLSVVCAVAALGGCASYEGADVNQYQTVSGGTLRETEPPTADPSLPRDPYAPGDIVLPDGGPSAPPP